MQKQKAWGLEKSVIQHHYWYSSSYSIFSHGLQLLLRHVLRQNMQCDCTSDLLESLHENQPATPTAPRVQWCLRVRDFAEMSLALRVTVAK